MDHKNARNIEALSRINGILFALAAMRGATITDKLSLEIECAAERLEMFIGDMVDEVTKDDEFRALDKEMPPHNFACDKKPHDQ